VPFNTDGTSTPMNAFNNFLLLGGTFSPATSLTLNNSSGGGSGTVVCSSMTTATGCTLKLTGTDNGTPSSPPTQLTLNMSGVSGNASGSATFILSYSTWNPKSFLTASHTGDFLMITVLSTPDNNGNYSGNVVVCPLPVQATCHLPTNAVTNAPDGTVQSDLYYTFHFSPLFQNKVEGIVDASLVLPMTNLTTSARSYIE
jgi:hypothetical protein